MNRKPMNRQKAEYVNELNMKDLIELESYNGYSLNRYYFDPNNEKLYLLTRNNKYKLIKPFNNGLMDLVSLIDITGKPHACSYKKLIRELKEWNEKDKNKNKVENEN